MHVDLQALVNLTHDQLNEAMLATGIKTITDTNASDELPTRPVTRSMGRKRPDILLSLNGLFMPRRKKRQSPQQRLLSLLGSDSTRLVLKKCLLDDEAAESIYPDDFQLMCHVTSILLKFMIEKNNYVSESTNGNTCLHDIVFCINNLLENLSENNDSMYRLLTRAIKFLLNQGANPDLTNDHMEKPIHCVIEYYFKCGDFEECYAIQMISYLLTGSVIHSNLPDTPLSASDIIRELLKLNTNQYVRELVYNHIINSLQNLDDYIHQFSFNLDEMSALLKSGEQILEHNEVTFTAFLGQGSFGTVHQGQIQHQADAVAIKISKSTIDGDIFQEAFICSLMHHPNIIRYLFPIERKDEVGFVMEYACGGKLSTYVRNHTRQFTSALLYSFTRQINSALRYIHLAIHYTHNDLNSGNILIDQTPPASPQIKLADFGTVKKQGEFRRTYLTTYAYCGPEGFTLDTTYQPEHDIFSLGSLIGFIYTHQHPWREINYDGEKIKTAVLTGKRTTFNNAAMPPAVANIVQWCWKQDPKERPTHDQIDAYLNQKLRL